MKNIVIIGAGASGLMAAAESAKRGNTVTVIEKMHRPARKVLISGKGRCNVTNACFDMEELISNVPTNPRFLYSAFANFMPYDMIAFLEDMGVPVKTERGNRVFPVSDKAADIVDALVKNAENCGANIINGTVKSFDFDHNKISAVILEDGRRMECDSVAICTGGKSYSSTGSSGDGYILAKSAGHSVTEIKPCLVPLVCTNNFIPKLQGLSLKNVSVRLMKDNKTVYSDFGEMLFTHFGISGPVVLSASSHIRNIKNGIYKMIVDLKPALDYDVLDKRILRDFSECNNKDFINSLSALLPKKLIPVIVLLSGIEPSKKVNEISRGERHRLGKLIKEFEINISDFFDIDAAIVTGGGINVKEINPKTMQSKIIENLYFAGEVIDVDAYTGGFNLQIAFSTGVLCGQNM